MDVCVPLFSLPPRGEFSGFYTFSQSLRAILSTESHPPLFPRAVHWDARTLDASSTSLPIPSLLKKKSQDCVPSSSPTEPSHLLISMPAAESPMDCWDPSWLLQSTPVAGAHASCCHPCRQLQSTQATAESHLPLFLVLSCLEAFKLWWISQYSGWGETGTVLLGSTLKV